MSLPDYQISADTDRKYAYLLNANTPEAFSQFYDRYSPLFYGLCCRCTDNEHKAEELLQQCFLLMYKNGKKYDPSKERLFSWMTGICRPLGIILKRSYTLPDQAIEAGTLVPAFPVPLTILPGYLPNPQKPARP
ncbi:MAG: sigma factor [Flavitalea sp.]